MAKPGNDQKKCADTDYANGFEKQPGIQADGIAQLLRDRKHE